MTLLLLALWSALLAPVQGGDLRVHLRNLRHEAPAERARAVRRLGRMGEQAQLAVRPLIALLEDPDPGVRADVVEALGRIGGEQTDACLAALVGALDDDADLVRSAIARVLPRFAGSPAPLVAALDDPDLARGALEALPAFGAAGRREVLLAMDREGLGPDAVYALQVAGRPAVPELLKALRREDLTREVVHALRRLGTASPYDAALLAETFKDTTLPPARAQAARWSLSGGPAEDAGVDELVELAAEGAGIWREVGVWALGTRGRAASEASAALEVWLADEDPFVRRAACWALGRVNEAVAPRAPGFFPGVGTDIGPHGGREVAGAVHKPLAGAEPARVRFLRTTFVEWPDKLDAFRPRVVASDVSPDLKRAVPALLERLRDPDHGVREGAAWALAGAAIDADPAFEATAACLRDPETGAETRRHLTDAWVAAACPPATRMKHLGPLLEDADVDVRVAAFEALSSTDAWEADAFLPRVLAGLSAADPREVQACTEALARATPPGAARLDEVLASYRRGNLRAAGLLGSMGAAAVEPLRADLAREETDRVVLALLALARLGPAALPARDEIDALTRVPSKEVRAAARQALGKIGS